MKRKIDVFTWADWAFPAKRPSNAVLLKQCRAGEIEAKKVGRGWYIEVTEAEAANILGETTCQN